MNLFKLLIVIFLLIFLALSEYEFQNGNETEAFFILAKAALIDITFLFFKGEEK